MPSYLLSIHSHHAAALVQLLEANKGALLLRLGWLSMTDLLITANPDDIRHIMQTHGNRYVKGEHWKERFDVFGKSYFNLDTDESKSHRLALRGYLGHPRFNCLLAERFRESVDKLSTTLRDASENGKVVDLKDCLQTLMFRTMCGAFAGCNNICELPVESYGKRFEKACTDSFEAILFRHVLPFWVWRTMKRLGLWKERNLSKAREIFDEIATYFVSEKRKQIQDGTSDDSDFSFLKLYMSRNKLFKSFPEEEPALNENFYSFLFAAEDTTTTALTWFFWLLGNHPKVEAKIVEELRSSFPKGSSVMELSMTEELRKLVYLHATICETLRLHPPVSFEYRTTFQPDTLPSGYNIGGQKATAVAMVTFAIGRMKHVWGEDCQEFKPERWITIDGQIKYEPPHKFFTFNAGPRMCPGKDIAFNMVKATIANILTDYRVKTEQDHPVSIRNSILGQMNGGLMAKIEKRD